MSDGEAMVARRCAFCDYDLVGLSSELCPECGRKQPPPSPPSPIRFIRADWLWLCIALLGMGAFTGLAALALSLGTALGVEYTGDVELVGFTVGFAVVAAAYAVIAVGIVRRRARFRRVESGRAAGISLVMLIGGFLAFALVFAVNTV